MLKSYRILAIESSCDDTCAAVILTGEKPQILSNVVSSQIDLHAITGGVVPEVASRAHMENVVPVVTEALIKAFQTDSSKNIAGNNKLATEYLQKNIDYIAYTAGPGLIGSLLVGYNAAKTIAYSLDLPIIPVNHIEGHIYSAFFEKFASKENTAIQFPALALTVSGGHTSLTLMHNHGEYENIGGTIDDAAGEAFDKVAKLLDLGYPGGPIVSKLAAEYRLKDIGNSNIVRACPPFVALAKNGRELLHPRKTEESKNKKTKCSNEKSPQGIVFPRPILHDGSFNFSFSGLKTAVLQAVLNIKKERELTKIDKMEIAAAFEDAVVDVLTTKTIRAAEKFKPRTVLLAGGVSANKELRNVLKNKIEKLESKVEFLTPPLSLCGDNAAMIGLAASFHLSNSKTTSWEKTDVDSNLKLS